MRRIFWTVAVVAGAWSSGEGFASVSADAADSNGAAERMAVSDSTASAVPERVEVKEETAHFVWKSGNAVDLGIIPFGESREGEAVFFNDGAEPLVIVEAFAECGCTKVDYPREAVAPGESGRIKVGYDSKGRGYGRFTKAVRLRTNAGQRVLMIVKGKTGRPYRK